MSDSDPFPESERRSFPPHLVAFLDAAVDAGATEIEVSQNDFELLARNAVLVFGEPPTTPNSIAIAMTFSTFIWRGIPIRWSRNCPEIETS